MDINEKLSTLVQASEVIRSVGIYTDPTLRQNVSSSIVYMLDDILAEIRKETAAVTKPKRQSKKTSQEPEVKVAEPNTEQAAKASSEPAVEVKEVEDSTPSDIDYAKDIVPAVREAASADRAKTVDLLHAYGATRATEVLEKDWPAFLSKLKEIIAGA